MQAEIEQLKPYWISVDECQEESNQGWCWVVYNGRVVSAYHDHKGVFRVSDYTDNFYMTECISAVMVWEKPAPPTKQHKRVRGRL